MMRLFIFIIMSSLIVSCENRTPLQPELKTQISRNIPKVQDSIPSDFIEINFEKLAIKNKMAYATDSNFIGKKIYPCARAFVRNEVYTSLVNACDIARKRGYELVLFDAYRPISIQRQMYDLVQNPNYVAHPDKGSKHNRGCAVDVGLSNIHGLVDMGTDFDDFSEKANYHASSISQSAKVNRKMLREIMVCAGFVPYEREWWHFNFKKTDYPISDFVWTCEN